MTSVTKEIYHTCHENGQSSQGARRGYNRASGRLHSSAAARTGPGRESAAGMTGVGIGAVHGELATRR